MKRQVSQLKEKSIMDKYTQIFPLEYTAKPCNRIYLHKNQFHVIKQTKTDSEQIFLKEFKQRHNHYPTHPHITECELVNIEDTEVIKMPYHQKDMFELIMDGKRFKEKEVIRFAYELALAINYWHKHNVLYADLKLENICLNDNHIKLIDFDRCKFIEADEELTVYSSTTASMPPEIIFNVLNRHRPKDHIGYGKEVDWWSYGVVIYELTYGIHPFHLGNETPNQVAQNILYREPQKTQKVIDHRLKDLLDSLLVKVRTKRLKIDRDVLEHPVFESLRE